MDAEDKPQRIFDALGLLKSTPGRHATAKML